MSVIICLSRTCGFVVKSLTFKNNYQKLSNASSVREFRISLAFEKSTALRNMLNVRQLKRIFNFTPQNAGRTSPFPSPANYPPNRANINVVHRLKWDLLLFSLNARNKNKRTSYFHFIVIRGGLVIKHTLVCRIGIEPASFTLRMLSDDTMYLQFLQNPVNRRWDSAYLLCLNKGACHKEALHHAVHLFCIATACGRHFLRVSCFFWLYRKTESGFS